MNAPVAKARAWAMCAFVLLIAGALAGCRAPVDAAACPNDGTLRFGVEPFGPAATLAHTYTDIAHLIEERLDCKVRLQLVTSYNAEIEAMRAGRLEFGQFGPMGYLLAHRLAHAEAVATFTGADGRAATYDTAIIVRADSPIRAIADLQGHSFAYTDPVSASGHLLPAVAMRTGGVDPDRGVKAIYTGSPTASFEALRNGKVDAAALASMEILAATQQGLYDAARYRIVWKSDLIPTDPLAVNGNLPAPFKARLADVLASLDLRELPQADREFLISLHKDGLRTAPQNDAAFEPLRGALATLDIDLDKL